MRLLHVIDSLATGGAERVAVNLCNGLAARSHDVHLVSTRAGGPLAADLDPAVHHLDLGRARTFDVGAARRFHRYVREHRIEVVHAHGTSAFFALAANLGRRRPPTIYHDHLGGASTAGRRIVLYRLLARRAAGIIAVNEDLRRWELDVARARPDRVWCLPNFSRLAALPSPPTPDPRPSPPAVGEPVEVVAVGNVRPPKDYPTLLAAVARVDPAVDVRLSIAGSLVDATEVARVRADIERLGLGERVELLGEVRDVGAVLGTADIAVSSSSSEGFSLSVLEYGLAGLAVVATDVGGSREILDGGRAGVLVPARDPAALGAALTRLAGSAAERERLGAALHEHVATHFSADRVLHDLVLIYERVVSM